MKFKFKLKVSPDCMAACRGDEDSFHLEFPENCDPSQRALLMASVLFLDFKFFEENTKPPKN